MSVSISDDILINVDMEVNRRLKSLSIAYIKYDDLTKHEGVKGDLP